MLYLLTYFDKEKNMEIAQYIEADTDRKAINKVEKILEGKKIDRPFLEELKGGES